MKWVRYLLAFAVAGVGFIVAAMAFNYGWQFKKLAATTDREPQRLEMATLIARGPGTRTHVEVTGFKFGKPLIEKNNEQWDTVWVPLLPTTGKSPTPVAFFRSTRLRSQEQLDEFLKQSSVTGYVANTALRKTVWGADVTKDLYLEYPKLDFDKLTIITEPVLNVPYVPKAPESPLVLTHEVLMASTTQSIAWGAGVVGILLGSLAVFVMMSPTPRTPSGELGCKADRNETGVSVFYRWFSGIPARLIDREELRRGREVLPQERVLSSHDYKIGGLVGTVVLYGFLFVAFYAVLAGVVFGTANLQRLGPVAAGGAGMIAMCIFMFLVNAARSAWTRQSNSAQRIQICPSGLRWQKGKKVGMAVWSEIAEVVRTRSLSNRKKQVMATQFGLIGAMAASMGSAGNEGDLQLDGDEVDILFHNGETLYFSFDSLSEYNQFAELLHEQHGAEARRYENGISGPMLANVFAAPGRSNRTMLDYRR